MQEGRHSWIEGTPAQAQAKLADLSEAGIDRALLSVNCNLHREMLPLLGAAVRI
jgi:hypothetical protein